MPAYDETAIRAAFIDTLDGIEFASGQPLRAVPAGGGNIAHGMVEVMPPRLSLTAVSEGNWTLLDTTWRLDVVALTTARTTIEGVHVDLGAMTWTLLYTLSDDTTLGGVVRGLLPADDGSEPRLDEARGEQALIRTLAFTVHH